MDKWQTPLDDDNEAYSAEPVPDFQTQVLKYHSSLLDERSNLQNQMEQASNRVSSINSELEALDNIVNYYNTAVSPIRQSNVVVRSRF